MLWAFTRNFNRTSSGRESVESGSKYTHPVGPERAVQASVNICADDFEK